MLQKSESYLFSENDATSEQLWRAEGSASNRIKTSESVLLSHHLFSQFLQFNLHQFNYLYTFYLKFCSRSLQPRGAASSSPAELPVCLLKQNPVGSAGWKNQQQFSCFLPAADWRNPGFCLHSWAGRTGGRQEVIWLLSGWPRSRRGNVLQRNWSGFVPLHVLLWKLPPSGSDLWPLTPNRSETGSGSNCS